MKNFKFTLERVLSWRQTQLSLEEAELERLRANLNAVQAEAVELGRRDQAAAEWVGSTKTFSGAEIADVARFRDWIQHEEKVLKARSAECQRQLDARSAVVTEARRKVKLVERLKERRLEAWTTGFNLELDQLAGESGLSRWRRDRSEAAG